MHTPSLLTPHKPSPLERRGVRRTLAAIVVLAAVLFPVTALSQWFSLI